MKTINVLLGIVFLSLVFCLYGEMKYGRGYEKGYTLAEEKAQQNYAGREAAWQAVIEDIEMKLAGEPAKFTTMKAGFRIYILIIPAKKTDRFGAIEYEISDCQVWRKRYADFWGGPLIDEKRLR